MVTIRVGLQEDAAAIARCHIAAWRDTYRPIVAEEYLNNLSLESHIAKWTTNLQPSKCHTFVAESDQGELIGFINGGPERTGRSDYRGEIYAIYVLKEWRGRGIGRRLVGRFSAALLKAGITSLIVWALIAITTSNSTSVNAPARSREPPTESIDRDSAVHAEPLTSPDGGRERTLPKLTR